MIAALLGGVWPGQSAIRSGVAAVSAPTTGAAKAQTVRMLASRANKSICRRTETACRIVFISRSGTQHTISLFIVSSDSSNLRGTPVYYTIQTCPATSGRSNRCCPLGQDKLHILHLLGHGPPGSVQIGAGLHGGLVLRAQRVFRPAGLDSHTRVLGGEQHGAGGRARNVERVVRALPSGNIPEVIVAE